MITKSQIMVHMVNVALSTFQHSAIDSFRLLTFRLGEIINELFFL